MVDAAAEHYRTNGKILFRLNHISYSCSGTAVNTPSLSVVLTAGHCLRDPGPHGTWATHVAYIPAYRDNARPFGTFVGRWGRVLRGHIAGNIKFDVGAFVVYPDSLGKLGKVTGAVGWATGLSRNQVWDVFGYPANLGDTERMQTCMSGWYGNDAHQDRRLGPRPVRIECNMGEGASGGGWVTAGGYLNGVVDYFYEGQYDRLYGPSSAAP